MVVVTNCQLSWNLVAVIASSAVSYHHHHDHHHNHKNNDNHHFDEDDVDYDCEEHVFNWIDLQYDFRCRPPFTFLESQSSERSYSADLSNLKLFLERLHNQH